MKPITTVEALKSLNEDEIVKGYLAGLKNAGKKMPTFNAAQTARVGTVNK